MRLSSRSNLVKFHQVNLQGEEARIINSNDRVAEKIAKLSQNIQKTLDDDNSESFSEDFADGINAAQVSRLLDADAGEYSEEYAEGFSEGTEEGFDPSADTNRNDGFVGGVSGNVIKAEPAYTGPSPEELLAEANEQVEAMLSEARQQAEELRQHAYEEASNQGYLDGVNKAQTEADERIAAIQAEFAEKEAHLIHVYQQKMEEVEPEMVNIITEVYEHVFEMKLADQRELILHLISNVLRKTESAGEYLIHISPEDHPFVSMQKDELLDLGGIQTANVELIEDITLKKNQCLIETENGIFDCSLGVELKELKKQLILLSYNGLEG